MVRQSLGELIRGLEKNAFSAHGLQRLADGLFLGSCRSLFNVWPFLAVFVVPGPTRWIYLAVCLTLWCMAWLAARGMKVPQSLRPGVSRWPCCCWSIFSGERCC